jgi:hypothetical protein
MHGLAGSIERNSNMRIRAGVVSHLDLPLICTGLRHDPPSVEKFVTVRII